MYAHAPPGGAPAPAPAPQSTEDMLRMVMSLTPDQLAALPPAQRAEIENLRAQIAQEAARAR
jgi:hypothetical protein